MYRRIMGIFLAIIGVLVIATGPARAETFNWRVQSAFARGDFSADLLPSFAAEVKEKSNGRINLQVFYAGDLVPADDTFKATRDGIIQMAQTCGVLWSGEVPILGLEFGLPFGFKGDLEEVERLVEEAGLYQMWKRAYARNNCHLLGIHTYGPYPAIASNKPIRTVADFKGLKVRAILEVADLLKELGAAPGYVPGGEIATALKFGTFDAATYSIDAIRGFKWHEIIDYYILPYWVDWYFGDVIVNQKAWDSLPEDLRKILQTAMVTYGNRVEEAYVKEMDVVVEKAAELGYQVITMPEEEVAKIRRIAIEKVWPKYAKKCPECAKAIENIRKFHGLE